MRASVAEVEIKSVAATLPQETIYEMSNSCTM